MMKQAPKTHDRIRLTVTVVTILVAACSATLSWHGLTQLGRHAGLGALAVFLPIVIDGSMLVGALHVRYSGLTGRSTKLGWTMTLCGLALSVWGNVAGAPDLSAASAIVHAVPAVALAASIEATMQITRQRATRDSAHAALIE